MSAVIDPLVEAAFLTPITKQVRRVDIFEADGTTPWLADAWVTGGSVSVDYGREERRSFDITFDNTDGRLTYDPSGFWYDKIIKAFRGVEYYDENSEHQIWETQIGEFMIDRIQEPHFPNIIKVTGRDYTKKMLTSKFPAATGFNAGQSLDAVVNAIAANAGVPGTKRNIPPTGQTLGRDFIFERGTPRWNACKDLATAYGYELFFDATGVLVMREFLDPTTSPLAYTLQTGAAGNLVNYNKSVNDSRLYNHVVVTGEAANTLPVWAEARNDNPASPTNIALIGDRVYEYVSSFITTQTQALEVAQAFLAIHSLQEYEVNYSSLMLPWLDVGEIVKFIDPKAAGVQPDRFLLSTLTIPLGLGAMSGTAKRVTVVG